MSWDSKIEEFKRKLVADRLATVPKEQRDRFNRIFPKGVPVGKLKESYDLIGRTLDAIERRKENEG